MDAVADIAPEALAEALEREAADYDLVGKSDRAKLARAQLKGAKSAPAPEPEPKGPAETTDAPAAPETATPPAPAKRSRRPRK